MFQERRYKLHKKTRKKLPIIMCYVCSKKCKMLTLTFLRDSYVTWEQRRLQITKFQAFGGLLGTFGGHFGSIWGTFSAHFGGPERTWKHIAYKRGGDSFDLIILGPKNRQNERFLVPKKLQNRGQNRTKKRNGKNNAKNYFFKHFLIKIYHFPYLSSIEK